MATFSIPEIRGKDVQIKAVTIGLDKVRQAAMQFGAKAAHEMAGAMYREMEFGVMSDSKSVEPTVPVDTGALRASGFTALPVMSGNEVIVESGYGGAATKYAIIQHENPDLRHDGEGEGAYFLSSHFERRAATMDIRMADEMRAKLGA